MVRWLYYRVRYGKFGLMLSAWRLLSLLFVVECRRYPIKYCCGVFKYLKFNDVVSPYDKKLQRKSVKCVNVDREECELWMRNESCLGSFCHTVHRLPPPNCSRTGTNFPHSAGAKRLYTRHATNAIKAWRTAMNTNLLTQHTTLFFLVCCTSSKFIAQFCLHRISYAIISHNFTCHIALSRAWIEI